MFWNAGILQYFHKKHFKFLQNSRETPPIRLDPYEFGHSLIDINDLLLCHCYLLLVPSNIPHSTDESIPIFQVSKTQIKHKKKERASPSILSNYMRRNKSSPLTELPGGTEARRETTALPPREPPLQKRIEEAGGEGDTARWGRAAPGRAQDVPDASAMGGGGGLVGERSGEGETGRRRKEEERGGRRRRGGGAERSGGFRAARIVGEFLGSASLSRLSFLVHNLGAPAPGRVIL